MYIDEQLIEEKRNHQEFFKQACPNPLKKKVYKLLRCNGKYLNRDNWERGLYLIAQKYDLFGKNKLLGTDRSFKTFFENYYRDESNFKNKILNEVEAKLDYSADCDIILRDRHGEELYFSNPCMTVEEFARLNPQGNYLLVTKCKIKNNCQQCIPVFEGRYLNNCNAHYWAVINAYKLKDLN